MTYKEFTERTGFYPEANLYKAIEDAYYDFDGDKDQFCEAYKANKDGMAEAIARAGCRNAEREIKRYEDQLWDVQDDLKEANRKIKMLEAQLEREQEWKPYIDETEVSDDDYANGKVAAFAILQDDDDAKNLIENEFGFSAKRITILHSKPVFEVSRHHQLRKIYEVERDPWYNASDWYYVRFQVCGMTYEAYNGSLIQH